LVNKTGELRFTGTSGNSCAYRIELNGNRIAAPARWRFEPSDNDTAEFRSFVIGQTIESGSKVGTITEAREGAVQDGALEKQGEHVKRFLKTGKHA
jgi:hypothetical protein